MRKQFTLWLALTILVMSGPRANAVVLKKGGKHKMEIKVTSPAFKEGGMIPSQHACDGKDVSPALSWTGVPAGTKSLVLIIDDPDAPRGTWVHWVVFNIPPDIQGFIEGVSPAGSMPKGVVQGTTDFGAPGYGGPCPPAGTHRYFFKIYALKSALNLTAQATKRHVEAAMQGHILAQGQLMGKYTRQK